MVAMETKEGETTTVEAAAECRGTEVEVGMVLLRTTLEGHHGSSPGPDTVHVSRPHPRWSRRISAHVVVDVYVVAPITPLTGAISLEITTYFRGSHLSNVINSEKE